MKGRPWHLKRASLSSCICLLAIGGALGLSACGGGSTTSTSGTASSGGGLSAGKSDPNATLVVNISTPIASLDPNFVYSDQEIGLVGAWYSMLTQPKHIEGPIKGTTETDLNATAVKPYVAESWQYSNGNQTLTFHLRPGLKFPNGDPVDSHAVVWSLERAINQGAAGASILEENNFKPPLIKSVSAPNPLTVVIDYNRPAPNQVGTVGASSAGAIYDPKMVEEHGGYHGSEPNKWLATHSAGYGPYLIKSYQPGQKIVLEANPNFFEPPKTKHVIINFIPSNETLLLDAQSGAADVTLGLTDQAAHSLEGNSCCTVAALTSRQAETLNFPQNDKKPWLNKNNPFFTNTKFRAALTYAFPYKEVLEHVVYGYGKLYYGEWMPSYTWYDPEIGAPRETNVTKAKQLLKESGVKTPVNFTIYVTEGSTIDKEVATVATSAWEPLGVHAKIQTVTPSDFNEVWYTTHAGVTVTPDGPAIVAPDYYWSYDLQCPPNNLYNDTNTCVPAADKLMKEYPYVTDEAKRQELLNKADELWIADSPRIWVYNQDVVSVLSSDVTEYYSSDLTEVRWWAKG